MLKLIKWLLIGVFGVVLIMAAIVAYLVFGIDPNTYKPELESLAAKNNIKLNIEGNIDWKVFPSLAISVGKTSVSGEGIPSANFRQADFSLDWAALLNRNISVNSITIDGADIQVESTDEGTSLAGLPAAAANGSQQASATSELPFQLSASKLVLTDSRLTVATAEGQQYVFEQVDFSSSNLNFEDKPFPVKVHFSTLLPSKTGAGRESQIDFSTDLSLNLSKKNLQLNGTELKVSNPAISVTFDASYIGDTDSVTVRSLQGKLPSGEFFGDITGQNIQTNPTLEGSINASKIQLQHWLESPPSGIKTASINADFSASKEAVNLSNYQVSLDDFSGTGTFSLVLTTPRQLEMTLNGNQLNLSTETGESTEADTAALLTPLLAPLALLEGGKGHIEASLDGITSNEYEIKSPKINLFANGKVIQIANLSGDIYDGQFQVSAKLDLRDQTPKINFSTQLNQIALSKAIPDSSNPDNPDPESSDLSGNLDFTFSGNSRGDSADALQRNLSGEGSFTVSEPRINNLNVEKNYCEMAALVEGLQAPARNWPNYTQLDALKGSLRIRDQIITLPDYTTRLGNIAINGRGKTNLLDQTYNMLINANLQGDKTSETGCVVKSTRVRNRDIPFNCTGSFAEGGEGSCAPDKSLITRILQEKLVNKLFNIEEPQPQAEDIAEPEAQEIEEEPPEEIDLEEQLKQKAVDSLLRGIFNQ